MVQAALALCMAGFSSRHPGQPPLARGLEGPSRLAQAGSICAR